MNNINLNLYKIFYTVAQSKSFIEASNKLYISQPAISKDIKTLEDELNTKLFYRKNDGITLTRDGEELIKYLEEAFGILNTGEKIIKQKNDLSHGIISIACPSHITLLYLMERIEKFKKNYPDIKIQLTNAANPQLIELLQSHKVDFIIDNIQPSTIYNNLEITPIKSFETIFICNEDKKINDIKQLEKEKLILPSYFSNARKVLDKTLQKYNIYTEASMEIDTTELIIDSVKRDLGIGYVIKDAVKMELDNHIVYELNINIQLPKINVYLINIKGELTNADKKLINEYLL